MERETMKSKESDVLNRLQVFIDQITQIAAFLILVIVFAVAVQVVARYGLNSFVKEIVPLVQQSFAVFILIGGLYITLKGVHIRVTVLYDLFSPKMKRFSKITSFICMMIFLGILVWQTTWMGFNSFMHKETMNGIYKFMPMYPLKIFIPIVSFFILIVGVIHFIKSWNNDD